jgi:hypothetical protein
MESEITIREYIVVKKFYFDSYYIRPHATFEEGEVITTYEEDYYTEFKNYHDCMVEVNLYNNIKSYLRRDKIKKALS